MVIVFAMVGGAFGTAARYLIGAWMFVWTGSAFPWGTLTINVLGSLVLGFVIGTSPPTALSPEVRAFLAVGLCGGFTTFSTYSYETMALLQSGAWMRAGAYALGSVVLGLVAILGGMAAAHTLLDR